MLAGAHLLVDGGHYLAHLAVELEHPLSKLRESLLDRLGRVLLFLSVILRLGESNLRRLRRAFRRRALPVKTQHAVDVGPDDHLVHLAEPGEVGSNLLRVGVARDVVNLHGVILQRDVADVDVLDRLLLLRGEPADEDDEDDREQALQEGDAHHHRSIVPVPRAVGDEPQESKLVFVRPRHRSQRGDGQAGELATLDLLVEHAGLDVRHDGEEPEEEHPEHHALAPQQRLKVQADAHGELSEFLRPGFPVRKGFVIRARRVALGLAELAVVRDAVDSHLVDVHPHRLQVVGHRESDVFDDGVALRSLRHPRDDDALALALVVNLREDVVFVVGFQDVGLDVHVDAHLLPEHVHGPRVRRRLGPRGLDVPTSVGCGRFGSAPRSLLDVPPRRLGLGGGGLLAGGGW